MKSGGSHRKGGAGERLAAKVLSLWLTAGKDYRQLIRSRSSGGWKAGTINSEDAWRQLGDLAPNGDEGERFRRVFAVEVKHHRNINFWTLWRTNLKKNTVATWWKKLQKEIVAADENLIPMLVFRSNSMPLMVGVPSWLVSEDDRAVVVPWLGMSLLPMDDFVAYSPDYIFERAAQRGFLCPS